MANNNEPITPLMVVVVPFPQQSHLNQLLQLSSVISSHYNLPLHYVCFSNHIHQVRHRFSNPLLLTKITFQELPFPTIPIPTPTRGGTLDSKTLGQAIMTLQQPLSALLQTLCSQAKKIVIIHDVLMSLVVDGAISSSNIELYTFHSTSAFFSFSVHGGGTVPIPEGIEFPNDLPSVEESSSKDSMEIMAKILGSMKARAGALQNTSRVIEANYVDLLARITQNTMRWVVGPLNQIELSYVNRGLLHSHAEPGKHKCLDWLDKQPHHSVMYISFGTTSSLLEGQVRELAIGLEESKIRFIWVLREADRLDSLALHDGDGDSSVLELLKGFEERTDGRGMVVREWVSQVEILGHPSTGGFMSHCGWSSCLESISAGVPIAAWPIHTDQPINATLMTRVLKIGIVVREWSRRKELVKASIIKEAVKALMVSEEGEMMRERARELGRSVCEDIAEEEGVSRLELESFINHITNNK